MILFMGVAGAGKSSQGRMLAGAKAYPWLSTGEFLRMLVSGERRKDMLAGKLLDDKEMIDLVDKVLRLIDKRDEFILDGFPRTKRQADWLLAQADAGLLQITCVVHLGASESVVTKRLLARGRQDDTKAVIKRRFSEYQQITLPILEKFKSNGIKVIDISSEDSPEAIHQEILKSFK